MLTGIETTHIRTRDQFLFETIYFFTLMPWERHESIYFLQLWVNNKQTRPFNFGKKTLNGAICLNWCGIFCLLFFRLLSSSLLLLVETQRFGHCILRPSSRIEWLKCFVTTNNNKDKDNGSKNNTQNIVRMMLVTTFEHQSPKDSTLQYRSGAGSTSS